MFEDSLVESSGKLARRNPWTLAFSLAVQMLAVGGLVLSPLIHTEGLPDKQLTSMLEMPPPPAGDAPKQLSKPPATKRTVDSDNDVLRPPNEVPSKVAAPKKEAEPATGAPVIAGGIPGGSGSGDPSGLLNSIIREIPIATPKVVPQKVPVSSGVAQGLLVHQVTPQYPSLARQARIQGTVVLQAVIGKDGTVQNLRVVSGHPMLTQAAMDAVKQWRYKPYCLNGQPVEVDTQVNVNFTLSGG